MVRAAPLLQLPWPTGQQHRISGGNTYGCDTHNLHTASSDSAYNADYWAIDFQFGPVDGSPLDVAAVAAGTVAQRDNYNDGYGNKVVLDHGGGFYSVYAHFRDGSTWGPGIVPGAHVSQGQVLGYAGGTGRDPPYPVHLHMHIQQGLSAYKPEPMSGVTNFGWYGYSVESGLGCGSNAHDPSPYWASSPTGYRILTLNTGFDEANPLCQQSYCAWHWLNPPNPPGGTTTATVLTSPSPGTPPNFVRLRSTQPGGSIYQDVVTSCPPGQCSVNPSPGDSYVFTIWARSAVPGVCVNATVVLWSMPYGVEHGAAPFQVCSMTWKIFAAPLDATQPRTYLRAQVYVDDAGIDVDIDATQLIQLRTKNSSFEATGDICQTCAWWKTFPSDPRYTTNALRWYDPSRVTEVPLGGGAAGGNYLLRANVTGGAGGSVYQDVPVVASSGEVYKLNIRLRSRTYGVTVSGSVTLWGINGPGMDESASVSYRTSTTAWREFTVSKTMTSGHKAVRVQVYLDTANQDVEIDGARFYKEN